MKVFALIPVNKLSMAKTRLAKKFSREERAELVMCMLRDVLSSVSGLVEIVIISEDDVRSELPEHDFHFILEEKRDLDNAVYLATEYAVEKGADATLFIPADIPLITRSHVEHILKLGKEYSVVIAPSKDGGTGVLFRKPPDIIEGKFSHTEGSAKGSRSCYRNNEVSAKDMRSCLREGSFSYHVAEAEKIGAKIFVLNSAPLSLDIDTPEDVSEFMNFGRGTRTYEFFARKLKLIEA